MKAKKCKPLAKIMRGAFKTFHFNQFNNNSNNNSNKTTDTYNNNNKEPATTVKP
jgi:hypothetical protein